MEFTDGVLLTILALFVGTQVVYLLGGLVVDLLLLLGPRNLISVPSSRRDDTMTVLVTLYREPRQVVEETLTSLSRQEYDLERVRVVLVYEAADEIVGGYVEDLLAKDDTAWTLEGFAVDRNDAQLVDRIALDWPMDPTEELPRTKAFALAAAYQSLHLDDEEIVTVFDADTVVDDDLFGLAVAGLEEYDVVQAKQTIRNHAQGILPTLEAMGMAAWSHIVYARTGNGPYQLLGKGYFLRARHLRALNGWQPTEITEDMAFGVAAYKQGLRLGVLDSYVQDLCPSELRPWIQQKRRWLGGPYRVLGRQPLSPWEKARLMGVTMVNQAVSLNTLIGLPVGLAVFAMVVSGATLPSPLWFQVLVIANVISWGIYSVLGYYATHRAVEFRNRREQLRFYLLSNPLTQAAYACLWSVPLLLAAHDHLTHAPEVFEVTPKEVPTDRQKGD